jgi:hypothetical protein
MNAAHSSPWVAQISFGIGKDPLWVGPVYPFDDTCEEAQHAIFEAARHTFKQRPTILRIHRGELHVHIHEPVAHDAAAPGRTIHSHLEETA